MRGNFTFWPNLHWKQGTSLHPIETLAEPSPLTLAFAVASWLARSSPDRAVWVRALAGNIELCSRARHFTLTVPLSKWVPANCWENLTNCWGVTCDGLAFRPGGVEILLAASCYRNRDKLQQLWATLGSKASLYSNKIIIEFSYKKLRKLFLKQLRNFVFSRSVSGQPRLWNAIHQRIEAQP